MQIYRFNIFNFLLYVPATYNIGPTYNDFFIFTEVLKNIANYYQDFIELLQNYYEARRVKKQVFSIFFLKVEAVQQMQTIFIILIRI